MSENRFKPDYLCDDPSCKSRELVAECLQEFNEEITRIESELEEAKEFIKEYSQQRLKFSFTETDGRMDDWLKRNGERE